MADDVKESGNDAEESSKFWDEAVSVRVNGKDAPVESEPEQSSRPDEEESKPSPEIEPQEGDSEEENIDEVEDTEAEDDGPDPWDGVPDELRQEFEETKKRAERFEHSARSNSGRLGALQKKIDELTRKLEDVNPPAQEKKEEPPVDPGDSIFDFPEWKAFEEDFGDVAKPQKAAMRRLFETLYSRLSDTEKVSKTLQEARNTERWAEQARILEGNHPGWRQLVQDHFDEFNDFVNASPHRQKLLEPNADIITDAAAGSDLFDLFKRHLNGKNGKVDEKEPKSKPKPRPLTQKRQKQLESAATVAPRSAPGPGRRSDDLPGPDEFDASFRYFSSIAER